MRRKRKKKIKISSYKRVYSQIKQYLNKKNGHTQRKDELVAALSSYIKKSGDLKKSMLRSGKQRSAYNELLAEWKDLYQPTISKRKKIQTFGKKEKEGEEKPFKKDIYKQTLDNQEALRKAFSPSEDETKATIAAGVEEMKDFFSDDLQSIFYRVAHVTEESEELSNKNALQLAFNAVIKKRDQLPELLKQYADADDRFNLIERCLQILNEKDINEEDLLKILEDANLKAAQGDYVDINEIG